MAVTSTGDVLINGRPYLLKRASYHVLESTASLPRFGGATAPEFLKGDNWTYFGQSDFLGMGEDDWIADGPFSDGYGIDISSVAGQIKVAKKLEQSQADTANAAWVRFKVGTTRLWYIGKTNGTGYRTEDGSAWTSAANVLAASVTPTSYGNFKGTHYVGASNGNLYSITTGTTFTSIASGGGATPSYALGSFKGKFYVGYANKLYTFLPAASWTEVFPQSVDGTPIMAAVGNGVLYIITEGPDSKVLMTDGTQLHQIANLGANFFPKECVFLDTLYIVGGEGETTPPGLVMRLSKEGVVPIFDYRTFGTGNYTIYTAMVHNNKMLWGASAVSGDGGLPGIGVYDPTLDIYEDSQMGFYVSSVASGLGTAQVNAIAEFKDVLYCGVANSGIFKQTTPGTFSITSSLYDGNTKNKNKHWGFAEVKHTALLAGQEITLETSSDGIVFDEWGTADTDDDTGFIVQAPTGFKAPYLQWRLTGDSNGSDLSILDVSLAYIEAVDNPKKEWDMVLELQGSEDRPQEMRDGTDNPYTAMEMFEELNGLWNQITTFDDLDGTQYEVIFRGPRAKAEDMIKDTIFGAIDDIVFYYKVRMVEISGTPVVSGGTSVYGRAVYG